MAGDRFGQAKGNPMLKQLLKYARDESGASMVEFALLAALLSVALVGILTSLQGEISTIFSDISSVIAGAI
jgi:pilus assembly protein Flp/PilA